MHKPTEAVEEIEYPPFHDGFLYFHFQNRYPARNLPAPIPRGYNWSSPTQLSVQYQNDEAGKEPKAASQSDAKFCLDGPNDILGSYKE